AYDAAGNRTLLVDADSGRFTYLFDADSRLSAARDPDGFWTTLSYDAASRRSKLVDGTGVTRTYQYDPVDRLTRQIDANAAGGSILNIADQYDGVGNRTQRNQDGFVTTWTYDAIYRLTGQQANGAWATFQYDPAGNIPLKWQQGSAPMTMAFNVANEITTIQ